METREDEANGARSLALLAHPGHQVCGGCGSHALPETHRDSAEEHACMHGPALFAQPSGYILSAMNTIVSGEENEKQNGTRQHGLRKFQVISID